MRVEKKREFSIGEVASQTGVAASALRYYEAEGLIAPSHREGGKRRYHPSIFPRVKMIRFAQQVGFSISEVRTLLKGFDSDGLPRTWSKMANQKISELTADAKRISQMLAILDGALQCQCLTLEICARSAGLLHEA